MNTLWINARFLDRPVTGVERVARELVAAIVANQLDSEGRWSAPDGGVWQLRLLAPADGSAPSPWRALPLTRAGWHRGHAWEQFDLPRLTRGEWLLNLCNTAPLFKRRQIVFLHDAQPFAIPQNFTLAFRSWYRLLYSVAGRSAAVVLTNSEFSRRELVERIGLAADKIVVCLLGSEHVQRIVPDDAAMARLGVPAEPFLLAVSSSSPNKNFAAVVRALEMLGSAGPPCVIVGAENERVFRTAALANSRVHRLGYVSDGELVALYRRALALVFPSFYEGFGLPPLEAMAQGCPVIVSRTGSLPEVGANAAMYCDPSDPATLASAIDQLQHRPPLRAHLAQLGKARAAEFSWRRAASVAMFAFAAQLPATRERLA